MIWFKNTIIYQINKDNILDKNEIEQAIKYHVFTPCSSMDMTKSGWISPYGENEENPLILDIKGQLLLRFKKEIKILPSSVIKQVLNEKIAQQENELSRKLKKIEKTALKEEIFIDLLPRAFSKYQQFWLWIDTIKKRVIIDTSSFKQAEDILALLRKGIGSLAVTPLSSETPLENIMTDWVRNGIEHPSIQLDNEIELADTIESNQIVRCKNQELHSHEILVHIDAGKQVNKIKLADEQGFSFILNRDYTLKRLKFDSQILDVNDDFMPEEKDKKLEADFIILSNVLSETIDSLLNIVN